MCGICGIINLNSKPAQETSIRQMMQTMKHRGPDDEGVFLDGNVGLGFVRLSILDLTPAGHQPMFSDDRRYVIVFNGEIFNYVEIREELKAKGHSFKTHTDTEVLLKAYQVWGEDCLHRFNGMWAFVIFDTIEKTIFAARDRYGIKPFYYYADNERLIFASEIPSILRVLGKKPEPNNQAIFDYLVFNRTDQTEETFFRGIKKLQHGSKLSIENLNLKIDKWYELRKELKEPFESPEEYKEFFSDAIRLRLRSDVPVGVCLSGGLDSSSIVSVLLNDHKKNDLNTFSAVYGKGQTGDESRFINIYKNQLDGMQFITPTAESLFRDKELFIRAHGEPIPSTAPYAQFRVMELAQKHVVVTLDGQGADEQLAGYHYFFGYYFKDLLRKLNFARLISESMHYVKNHRSLYGIMTLAFFMLPERFRNSVRATKRGYLNPGFVSNHSSGNTIAGELYGSPSLTDALINHFEYKLEHLLKWEDRNSMWHSIEARVPFLDYRLVERTLSLPSELVINKGFTKHILRQAMKTTLPEEIRMRKDKVGFDTPQDEWFRTDSFKTFIFDLIRSDNFRNRGFIDATKAEEMYSQHLSRKINIAKDIWKWIHLELWFREFID